MGQLKPNQILNKAYRQVAIETEDYTLIVITLRNFQKNSDIDKLYHH